MSKRIELTISTDYVKHWGIVEGVRELMQNALDADRVRGLKMEVEYDEDLMELKIVTHGTVLETKTLLLGVSDKGGVDAVGKWGEGYKLAVLALCRKGKSVLIDTGDETWRPRFVKSSTFGVTVLAFDIDKVKTSSRQEKICVTVGGISPVEWAEMRLLFAHTQTWRSMRQTQLVEMYSTSRSDLKATVLYDPEQRGRIYVGGIFVSVEPSLQHGYDLPPSLFELDRDRRSLDSWALKTCLGRVWQSVLCDLIDDGNIAGKEFDTIWSFVGDGTGDVAGLAESDWGMSPLFTRGVFETFEKVHGSDAYPASSFDEEKRARALGLKAIRVPKVFYKVISKRLPTLDQKEREQERKIEQSWAIESLPAAEMELFKKAWAMVVTAGRQVTKDLSISSRDLPEPQAAKFNSSKVLGLHLDDRQVYVSRDLLQKSRWGTLVVTLLHEWGHHFVQDHGNQLLMVIEQAMEVILQRTMNEGTVADLEIEISDPLPVDPLDKQNTSEHDDADDLPFRAIGAA